MAATRVLVVDPHPVLASSLSASLDEDGTFAAQACTSYLEVPDCLHSFHPEIIVINVYQGSTEGALLACREIAALPGGHVIVLIAPRSVVAGELFSLDALEAGADGVLISEELDLAKLRKALTDVEAGHSLLDPKQLREALALRRTQSRAIPAELAELSELTPRELEIADLIIGGSSTIEIAEQLGISERTVQNHISNILTKLNVRTRAEAIALLYRWRHAGDAPARARDAVA